MAAVSAVVGRNPPGACAFLGATTSMEAILRVSASDLTGTHAHSAFGSESGRSPAARAIGPPLASPPSMYSGGALFLIAVGAILHWAVTLHINGVNLNMVGLILMAIGAVGLVLSLLSSATLRRRVS